MISRTTACFRDALAALPDDVRGRARQAYHRFHDNPDHPGLRFKKVHDEQPIYSARVDRDHRALGVMEGDTVIWFWIGNHAAYERMLGNL